VVGLSLPGSAQGHCVACRLWPADGTGLDAPDVALAEAAIGAGLTGALLLATLVRLQKTRTVALGGDIVQSHIHNEFNGEER